MINSEFLITTLIVVLIPGTGVIYTVSTGIFMGFKSSVAAALGCTFGIVPHLAAGILGISAILHMGAVFFSVIKYAGAVYLLYLSYCMFKETGSLSFSEEVKEKNYFKIAVRGVLINLLNPKLTIFFLAFLPLFIKPDSGTVIFDMSLLSLIFMAMTFGIFVIYGFLADRIRKYVVDSPKAVKIMQRSFAAGFAALGVKLALTER